MPRFVFAFMLMLVVAACAPEAAPTSTPLPPTHTPTATPTPIPPTASPRLPFNAEIERANDSFRLRLTGDGVYRCDDPRMLGDIALPGVQTISVQDEQDRMLMLQFPLETTAGVYRLDENITLSAFLGDDVYTQAIEGDITFAALPTGPDERAAGNIRARLQNANGETIGIRATFDFTSIGRVAAGAGVNLDAWYCGEAPTPAENDYIANISGAQVRVMQGQATFNCPLIALEQPDAAVNFEIAPDATPGTYALSTKPEDNTPGYYAAIILDPEGAYFNGVEGTLTLDTLPDETTNQLSGSFNLTVQNDAGTDTVSANGIFNFTTSGTCP